MGYRERIFDTTHGREASWLDSRIACIVSYTGWTLDYVLPTHARRFTGLIALHCIICIFALYCIQGPPPGLTSCILYLTNR